MKLPVVSPKYLCNFLTKEGFVCVRQKGSHRIFRHSDGRMTVVPVHSNYELGKGLLLRILNDIGLSRDDFIKKFR